MRKIRKIYDGTKRLDIKTKKTKGFFLKVVSLLILCAVLVSCGSKGTTAMTLTYGKNTTTFSSNIYSYYLSYTKTSSLASVYLNLGASAEDIPNMSDWPDFWANPHPYAPELTYGDVAKLQAEESLKSLLAVAAYCKENDLKLSKEELNDIDVAVKALIASDKYKNSKAAFNSVLIRFDIDDSIYKEIKKYESLTGVFGKDLFDSVNGKRKITEDMINQIYQETCARVKHILILYSPGTRDAEGNPEQFSEEELAERKAKVDELYERITAGEDFDSLLEESEDPGTLAYPDGYTISETTNFVPEFVDAAFDMKIGEVRKVESDYGMHIMKRYSLLDAAQSMDIDTRNSWRSVVNTRIQRYIMDDVLQPYIDKIEVNTDETNLFTIESSAVMFDCLELW